MKRVLPAAAALVIAMAGLVTWFRDPGARSARPMPTVTLPAEPTAADLCRMQEAVAVAAPSLPAPALNPSPSTPVLFTPVSAGLPQRRTPLRTVPAAPPAPAVAGSPPPPAPAEAGEEAMEQVQTMLRDYRTRMGDNPVGSNAEIMRAVMGGNPVQAHLGPPPGQRLNESGELLDAWGVPYFFHQMSARSMEVRSAGPDRKLWSTDDLLSQ